MKKLIFFLLIITQLFRAQSDCPTAITVCGNNNISYTPTGPGSILEDLGGCLTDDENYSVWYTFSIATAGTLTMLITPNAQADYDWAIYGPNTQCSNLGTPIRCSFAGTGSGILTGMNLTATDTTEGGGGDGFVRYLDVLPGQTYYMVIDNFSNNTNGFVLTWGGTATLASSFNDPTLTPFPFVAPGPNQDGNVILCTVPSIFDFSTLTSGIVNGNPNFTVSYHTTSNNALTGASPITTPISVNGSTPYYYSIHYQDPANPNNPINNCRQVGTINFVPGNITVNNATITKCNNNNSGTAVFDLTSVANAMYNDPTAVWKYYPTINDMNNNTNVITLPTAYTSAAGQVYAQATTTQGCVNHGIITLAFYPIAVTQEASLTSCFIPANPTTAQFNLMMAAVTTQPGTTKTFHPSQQDAINNTNQIMNPTTYIAPNSVVYARVTTSNDCWNIAKITLNVTPPVYSTVLKDKIICVEDKTTLDAGPGFSAYAWSTGATTASISNVSVGEYYVDLTTEGCVTRQTVKVYASPVPVITNIDITNSVVTVNVEGGTKPYQYSLDGVLWQNTNVFNNVPRGMSNIFVKDAYDCDPVVTEITVPNLVNAITPNGDNTNDYVDYSALSYKKDVIFSVYDRYGNKIHQGDKTNGYRWDGRTGGRKVVTGNYWYTITWTEPVTKALVKYSGWIMVKNRE